MEGSHHLLYSNILSLKGYLYIIIIYDITITFNLKFILKFFLEKY